MKTKLQFLLFVIAITSFQVGCGTSAVNSQTKVIENGDVIAERDRPADEARIEDEFERIKWDGNDKEDLMKQSAPKFFMIFECEATQQPNCINGELREELPEDAQELVSRYWQERLDYNYVMRTDRVISVDAETNNRLDNSLMSSITQFEKDIQKISVKALNGERKFSSGESTQMVHILNNRSCQTVQQSDECKIYDRKTKEWQ